MNEATKRYLTAPQRAAIQMYRERNGRAWKTRLNDAWMNATVTNELERVLHGLRNSHGPSWLCDVDVDRAVERSRIIDDVWAYALERYADGDGWDMIRECFTRDEISAAIGNARTLNGALKVLRKIARAWADRALDVREAGGR